MRYRESHLDVEIEEHEDSHVIEDLVPYSPHKDILREEHSSPYFIPDSVDPVELVGPSEMPIDGPPT